MCGIAGALVFNNNDFRITESYIDKMRDTMVHRGPDGAGTWVSSDGRVGLGHRRLSIIDLSESAGQPMCNEDASLWVSYNGEIYNHAAIRDQLQRIRPRRWKTDHSDTEVILHAFEEWGIECIDKFRGMFSFALWDAKRREMWLVRDRIGVKPLYYSNHHGRLTFASEVKALLTDPDQKRAVNEESLFHFLSWSFTPAPQTLFDGIMKLPGGCLLRASERGDVEVRRYWDVLENAVDLESVSEDEVAERVLAELRESVKLRKVSDVPVGVFLSGGLDSSTNTALFSEGEAGPVKTFTIGYEGEYDTYKNEIDYARLMADEVGAKYHERLLNVDDLVDFMPRMVHLQDEPIADPVCVPVYYVSKLARDNGVKVCQVGEGADELYWGYGTWKNMLYLQRWDDLPVPRAFKKAGLAALRVAGKSGSLYYEWLRRGAQGQPVFWGGVEGFSEVRKRLALSPDLARKFAGRTSWDALRPLRERFDNGAIPRSNLNWMTFLDLSMRLPELLLMRVDKMSMGVSLETRVPFLDHKFVELAMGVPESMKTRNGTLKHLLKKSVRGVIPDVLIDRPKQGFGVPVHEWFFDRLGAEAKRDIGYFLDNTNLLNAAYVKQLFDQRDFSLLWFLYNLSLWWKEFIE